LKRRGAFSVPASFADSSFRFAKAARPVADSLLKAKFICLNVDFPVFAVEKCILFLYSNLLGSLFKILIIRLMVSGNFTDR
jgi:hypothetical protein